MSGAQIFIAHASSFQCTNKLQGFTVLTGETRMWPISGANRFLRVALTVIRELQLTNIKQSVGCILYDKFFGSGL